MAGNKKMASSGGRATVHSGFRATSLGLKSSAALLILVVPAVLATIPTGARSGNDLISLDAPRVVVVKGARTLHLLDGERLVRSYPIDLGVAPIGTKRHKGDGRTPMGAFRVVTKNAKSPYYRFIGVDYPDAATVDWGLTRGLISEGEAASIRQALKAGRCPDWNTALGGGIGIHGHRVGRDWTGGCIALADEHVAELFAVLRIGDPVEILP